MPRGQLIRRCGAAVEVWIGAGTRRWLWLRVLRRSQLLLELLELSGDLFEEFLNLCFHLFLIARGHGSSTG